jgi:protein gp37
VAENTGIEWCDHTINFWWGCAKVSPACANCYAEGLAARFHTGLWGADGERRLRVDAARLEALRYERRAVKEGRRFRVFTNSMSDFFEDRPDLVEARQEALSTIMATPHLDWLILTKRPENIIRALQEAQRQALGGDMGFAYTAPGTNALSEWLGWWLSGKAPANVWLGTR